jgi:hypothetical protein
MKIYIKSLNDNTYLNPFVYGEQWVEDFNNAHPFEIDKEELDDLDIEDIAVDCFINKDNLIIVYEQNNEIIEHEKFVEVILSYEDFLKTKKTFLLCDDKMFEHYLIYTCIKKQDPYRAISLGKNKFHQTLSKIRYIIYMIENIDRFYSHLKIPFSEISDNDFKTILIKIKNKLS